MFYNNEFPYSDLHELNLDWIVKVMNGYENATFEVIESESFKLEVTTDPETLRKHFVFYLPRGAQGPEGPQGPQGPQGPSGLQYTLVSSEHVNIPTLGGATFTLASPPSYPAGLLVGAVIYLNSGMVQEVFFDIKPNIIWTYGIAHAICENMSTVLAQTPSTPPPNMAYHISDNQLTLYYPYSSDIVTNATVTEIWRY